jgi:hypothetical protein
MGNESLGITATFPTHFDAQARQSMLSRMLELSSQTDHKSHADNDKSSMPECVAVAWIGYANSRETTPSLS